MASPDPSPPGGAIGASASTNPAADPHVFGGQGSATETGVYMSSASIIFHAVPTRRPTARQLSQSDAWMVDLDAESGMVFTNAAHLTDWVLAIIERLPVDQKIRLAVETGRICDEAVA